MNGGGYVNCWKQAGSIAQNRGGDVGVGGVVGEALELRVMIFAKHMAFHPARLAHVPNMHSFKSGRDGAEIR